MRAFLAEYFLLFKILLHVLLVFLQVLVLSGKGGVGKSTVTANLARCLATKPDLNIGILGWYCLIIMFFYIFIFFHFK